MDYALLVISQRYLLGISTSYRLSRVILKHYDGMPTVVLLFSFSGTGFTHHVKDYKQFLATKLRKFEYSIFLWYDVMPLVNSHGNLRKACYLHLQSLKIIRRFRSSRTGQPASSRRWKLFSNSQGIISQKTLTSVNKKLSAWNGADKRGSGKPVQVTGGPPSRKREQGPSLLLMLLSFPAVSDVIR